MKRLATIGVFIVMGVLARADSFSIIYTFPNLQAGDGPLGAPYIDSAGVIYGTTDLGGTVPCNAFTLGCGTVFSLTPPVQPGGAWTENVLYDFKGGTDGAVPLSGVLGGPGGTLLGTTGSGGLSVAGCSGGCGTFFQLTPPAQAGQTWSEQVLLEFGPTEKESFGLTPAPNGAFVGAVIYGGNPSCDLGCGSLYELLPPQAPNASWTLNILYGFSGGKRGANPTPSLTAGPGGVYYGAVEQGGLYNNAGAVFALMPPQPPGVNWTAQPLYSFHGGKDGSFPNTALVVGADGTVYGTTRFGGGTGCGRVGCGTVFSLKPPAQPGGTWTESVIYAFQGGNDAAEPQLGEGLLLGPGGVLYGTTSEGGGTGCNGLGCGVLYKLTPPAVVGGAWTETILHAFSGGSDGSYPLAPVLDANGVLYGFAFGGTGTACNGGGCGVVFQYMP